MQNKNSAHASRFLYISLPSLNDYDVKIPNFTFCGWGHKTATFFFFSWISIHSFRIQLQKRNCHHLTNWTGRFRSRCGLYCLSSQIWHNKWSLWPFLCLLPQQNTGNRRASTPTSELKGIREESEESEQGKSKRVTSANAQNDKEEVITCKSVRNKTGGVEASKYPSCRSEIYDFLVLQFLTISIRFVPRESETAYAKLWGKKLENVKSRQYVRFLV